MASVRYATRRSALALAQCRAFVRALSAAHTDLHTEELQVVTSGDRIQDRPLSEVGGKGLFVKEIEEALLDGRADFAVHSIKDVPALIPPGLALTCIPKREDPRDVIVAPRHRTLAALPKGATVGTSSLRRAISLKAARPDLSIVPLRGNVDTRLRKVDAGECDAIVLARAGLVRLGLEARATEVLEPTVSLPAVGQGALGIETRADDAATRAILSPMHDHETAICVWAERGVMEALEGDCRTPLAAYAERRAERHAKNAENAENERDMLTLTAFVAEPDGSRHRRIARSIAWPAQLPPEEAEAVALRFGREVGEALKAS
jgi:hydroxymethylbilane synthase